MTKRGLVGYTGFVGGNLDRQTDFTHRYNSRNIEDIRGEQFDLLVCAGAPAEKWRANANPRHDREVLARLTDALLACEAARVVLISTVDVYPNPVGVVEDTMVDPTGLQPYGKHRLELERSISERFPTLVVRLPGLYGTGLRKNVIFDFLRNNQTEKIHSEGIFQFYGLDRLWSDIAIAQANELTLVNLPTEPVSVKDLVREVFGEEFDNRPTPDAACYDVRTRYASTFGGAGGYVESRKQVLEGIGRFVAQERASPGTGGAAL